MDALDSVAVSVSSNEDDRYIAFLSKRPSGLDSFAASFEIDVHQNNVGLVGPCKAASLYFIRRYIAKVET